MSEAYCDVDLADQCDEADPVEFVSRRLVVGRKPHICHECRNEISVGEQHEVAAYKFEGEFACDRTCASCREAAREFGYHLLGGSLWEMFEGEWDNGANVQGCINRLTTATAKEHMRQRWAKWQEQRVDNAKRLAAFRAAKQEKPDVGNG